MRRILIRPTLASCLLLCSCASAGGAHPIPPGELISADEVLSATAANTAYDLVTHLRPQFLQSRGPTSLLIATPRLPDVSIDGGLVEQVDVMKNISAQDVVDIRLLDRWKAEQMLGGPHGAGTILVRLRRLR
jgi:hypothetical protein